MATYKKKCKNTRRNAIYKLCNYKTDKAFKHLHTYSGKIRKKHFPYMEKWKVANSENKYDFPPPLIHPYFLSHVYIKKK